MKSKILAKILYLLSIISYVTFLMTQENIFLLLGGLLLVAASIVTLIINKKANK